GAPGPPAAARLRDRRLEALCPGVPRGAGLARGVRDPDRPSGRSLCPDPGDGTRSSRAPVDPARRPRRRADPCLRPALVRGTLGGTPGPAGPAGPPPAPGIPDRAATEDRTTAIPGTPRVAESFPPGAEADESLAGPRTVATLSLGGPDAPSVRVPILEGPGLDEHWLRSQPSALPDYVVRQWERQGYAVEQSRRYMSVDLNDGRRLEVPLDEIKVQFVGN